MKPSRCSPNPFMIQPVLKVLFKNCDAETLKVSRLVCKLWLNTSLLAFLHATQINFYSMHPKTYAQLLESLETGFLIEPVHVALTLSSERSNSDLLEEKHQTVSPLNVCKEFIFPLGAFIQSLKFYAWDFVSDQMDDLLFSKLLLTPTCLKSLELSLLPRSITNVPLFPQPWTCRPPLVYLHSLVMYGKIDCSQEFMVNLLGAMPNVRSITVNCCSTEFLDVFCPALHQVPLLKVHHLKLNFVEVFSESHISHIEKANLDLKTLHTAQRSMVTCFDSYTHLLKKLAGSLEDAKLTCCTGFLNIEYYLTLPFLPKLKILRVQSWRSGHAIWNLDFVNCLPNLECLTLERRGLGVCFVPDICRCDLDVNCFLMVTGVQPHDKLKSLVLPVMPMLFPTEHSLLQLFPNFLNLAKLSLSADDKCLQCVFQNAPKLQELVITEYSRITDDGLTGLVFGYNDLYYQLDCNDNHEIPQNMNASLGITALKELKKLELDGFGGRITDFSVKHGIAHLDKLHSVILRSCRISNDGIKMLAKIQITVVGHDIVHTYAPE